MTNVKRQEENLLAFRGQPEDEVLEVLSHWKDWCAELANVLLAGGAPAAREGASDDATSDGPFNEPEFPFVALPYAVRIGARRAAATA